MHPVVALQTSTIQKTLRPRNKTTRKEYSYKKLNLTTSWEWACISRLRKLQKPPTTINYNNPIRLFIYCDWTRSTQ